MFAIKPYTKAFAEIYSDLREKFKGWDYLFGAEKVELTIDIIALMEQAYDQAFADCEEQDSGFAGSTQWTNNNPYRKDADVLDIIADVQRNL
jgi:hypothetical protein